MISRKNLTFLFKTLLCKTIFCQTKTQKYLTVFSLDDHVSHSIMNLRIRTNWLLNIVTHEPAIVLKQAFMYTMAENDINRAIASSFPEELIETLKIQLENIQSGVFYENLRKEKTTFLSLIKSNYFLKKDTCLIQFEGIGNKMIYLRVNVSYEGVFYSDESKKSILPFPIRLVSLDVQNRPLYPLLNKKLFQGLIPWNPVAAESDSQYRIMMNLINDQHEVQQYAIYFMNFKALQKIKNIFIIFSKKAVHSIHFIKFLAVN